MKPLKHWGFVSLLFINCFFACKTVPVTKDNSQVIQIEQASLQDIRAYGVSYEQNPYMEPKTLIRGKLNEFFVVKVTLNLPVRSVISVLADAKTADGTEAARPYTRDDFVAFWDNVIVQNEDSYKYNQKITTIRRSCIPSFFFTEGAGQTVYFIPFVGKYPISRPAKIYVQVSVTGQGEPCTYTYDLLNQPQ
ncbi:MAG: hypothetical protein LLF89_00520 [Spirochaetaceae bacterium]|nr:hypothetical protein [Spirochaetaceae bacterium]